MLSTRSSRCLMIGVGTFRTHVISTTRYYSSKPPKIEGELSKDVTSGANKRRMAPFSKKMGKNRVYSKRKDYVPGQEDGSSVEGPRIVMKSSTSEEQKNSHYNEFISFDRFPKIPESVKNQSVEELYSSINMKPWINTLPVEEKTEEEVVEGPKHFVDFSIPGKYIKSSASKEITEKDRALVEELDNFLKSEDEADVAQSQLNLIKLYYDQDSNSFQPMPEHSLKKSLSGMINLNPALNDIDDEYLWKVIPHNKQFGSPPFEKNPKTSFIDWEKNMTKKKIVEDSVKEKDEKEVKQFLERFDSQKSFFKKNSAGGRKKLDRQLLKMYKKLKQDGKLPKELDYIDENKLF